MRKTLLLAILYAVFAAGALGTCLWGRAGFQGYRELEAHRAAVQANIRELESRNQALTLRLERLRTDSTAVQLLVRDMGYLEENEHRVILPAYEPPPATPLVGHVLTSPPARPGPRRETLYVLPLILFVVAHALMTARRRGDG